MLLLLLLIFFYIWGYSCSPLFQNQKQHVQLFWAGYACPPDVLQTELVPFLSLIDVTLHDPGTYKYFEKASIKAKIVFIDFIGFKYKIPYPDITLLLHIL